MNYSAQYQRFRRTDVTISSKSLLILRVTPLNGSRYIIYTSIGKVQDNGLKCSGLRECP